MKKIFAKSSQPEDIADARAAVALEAMWEISAAYAAEMNTYMNSELPLTLALLLPEGDILKVARSGFPVAKTDSLLKYLPKSGQWPEACKQLAQASHVQGKYVCSLQDGSSGLSPLGKKIALSFIERVARETPFYTTALRPSQLREPDRAPVVDITTADSKQGAEAGSGTVFAPAQQAG